MYLYSIQGIPTNQKKQCICIHIHMFVFLLSTSFSQTNSHWARPTKYTWQVEQAMTPLQAHSIYSLMQRGLWHGKTLCVGCLCSCGALWCKNHSKSFWHKKDLTKRFGRLCWWLKSFKKASLDLGPGPELISAKLVFTYKMQPGFPQLLDKVKQNHTLSEYRKC